MQFLAASAFFLALISGPALLFYRHYITTGRLASGDINFGTFMLMVVLYVLLATALGWLVGYGHSRAWRWVVALVGDSPEPRVWDYLWRLGAEAVVRIKLKSGTWLAGVFATSSSGRRSYAAGYAEAGDLHLSLQVRVDPLTGEFARENGLPIPAGASGPLLRWEKIEYLEFQEFTHDPADHRQKEVER